MRKLLFLCALLLLATPVLAERSGHIAALSVVDENSTFGSVADIFLEIKPGTGAVYIESLPLTKIDTQISTRLAKETACQRSSVDCSNYDFFYIINVPSSVIGGPSAGGAISVLTYALLEDLPLRNDTAMTGTIMSGGIIGPVGGVRAKVAGAAASGYSVALVPAWDYAENGIPLDDRYNISVMRIRTLDEAIYYFTGEQPEPQEEMPPPQGYTEGMSQVSEALCSRAATLITEAAQLNSSNSTEQYDLGREAQARGAHYSAASLCFSANLASQTARFTNMTIGERQRVVRSLIEERADFEQELSLQRIDSIADLEVSLIVTERLENVKEAVSAMDTTDPEPAQLAYAYERLETARAWHTLLGVIESKEVEITDAQIALSCKQKLDEAQERINYLAYIYPQYTGSLENSLREAFMSAQGQQYSLCLLQASQAKAEANSLLTALYVPEGEIQGMLTEKLLASERQLSKQTEAGTFPILGYSYNEYSVELRERDPYSALLYVEYGLELGALDIYFPPSRKNGVIIDRQLLLVFITGALLGGMTGALLSSVFRRERETHRPKSATPKRNAPGKKR